MPLSPPVPRTPQHQRRIEIDGYEREDGLFDIEASITDTKSYPFENFDRGRIEPGVPLHRMLARMTLDEGLRIVRFEANTEYSPFSICPDAAHNFARLAGLVIGRGFLRAANERVGGIHGCTHIRELLGQMGTVAFQTLFVLRHRRAADDPKAASDIPAALLGTCYAYAPDSPVVKRKWPDGVPGA